MHIIKNIYKKIIGYTIKNIKNIDIAVKEEIDYIIFDQEISMINRQSLSKYADKIPIALKDYSKINERMNTKDVYCFSAFKACEKN